MLASLPLATGWTLTCLTRVTDRPDLPVLIPATVPGTVHTDLLAAGLLADPYLDLNELRQDWVGREDWRYETVFEWQPGGDGERVDLACDGLDTFARVEVNGALVGETANQNRRYRFDVTEALIAGRNRLTITFRSAWAVGAGLAAATEQRPANYPGPANLMRKMACNFGWDWGPTVVTAGVWKPIRLERWRTARLAEVRPAVTLTGGDGRVRVFVDLERAADGPLHVMASVAGVSETVEVLPGARHAELMLTVPAPDIWWPHHLGRQPLYPLTVNLSDGDGHLIDGWQRRIGFRSIRLDTRPDAAGRAFTLVVNDVAIFACGANWIPDDCFLPRVTPERYRARIAQARDANINLLRVWGGGIYETDAFYDACDEAGILVWQDFLFACAAYEDDAGPLPAEVEAEARDNVARLMPHPSLVLWNGNNENIWGYVAWGWQADLGDRSWGAEFYFGLLPKVVAEVDPTRPYWPGSPYSGTMALHPNEPGHGCMHIWDVWNSVGYEVYRNYIPRFCSEFGWQAPPTWATLTQSVGDDPLAPDSPGVMHHQKATDGNVKLIRGLAGHLPEPQGFDDWLWTTQLNQARAIRFGVEHMRSHRGVCMGAVVWQLNDCWPVTSWAAVDGYGRKKPLWYALRAAYDPHLLTIQPRDGGLAVVAVNERTLYWRAPIELKRIRFDGTVLASDTIWRLSADRLSSETALLPAAIATPEDPAGEMIVATMLDSTAYWYFAEDVAARLPAPEAEVVVEGIEGGYAVTVKAGTLLKDLCLFVDRLHPDATVDDMLVTLLPGEIRTFRVTSPSPLDVAAFGRAPVLRSAADLLAR
jgi:beta-mannosidase